MLHAGPIVYSCPGGGLILTKRNVQLAVVANALVFLVAIAGAGLCTFLIY